MSRFNIVPLTAKRIITEWDYSNLDDVVLYGMVIDLRAAIVKLAVLLFQLLCIASLPLSFFVVIKIGRYCEIKNLKSWVKTIRRDRGFFTQYYYTEIKQHIRENKESYHLTLNW